MGGVGSPDQSALKVGYRKANIREAGHGPTTTRTTHVVVIDQI